MGELNILVVTTIGGIIATVISAMIGIYRENRNRKWDLEDRNNARKLLENKVAEQQEKMSRQTDEQTTVLTRKIDESGKINSQEASNINDRLLNLSKQFDSFPVTNYIAKQVTDVSRLVEETNDLIKGFKKDGNKT